MPLPRSCSTLSLMTVIPMATGVLGGLSTATTVHAQTITPRTVPVQMGQQFDVVPSDRGALGGVTIGIDDAILDPFVNPAKAMLLKTGMFTVAPYFHGQSDNRGGGRTFPVSAMFTNGRWAGGGLVAMQQLDRSGWLFNLPTSERTASNQYFQGFLARSLGNGYALGGSLYAATLEAEQGIDLLYSGSDRISQSGAASDVRVGLTRRWGEGRQFEAMVLQSRFDMSHDVHFPSFRPWVNGAPGEVVAARDEHHRDQTTRWGAHTEYSRPVGVEGWRVGLVGTVNRLSHPKIPDYRINNVITVPRDPGHTWAYNTGIGLSRVAGKTTFGFEALVEPMFSTTWAEAARDTVSVNGSLIRQGGHTVDNRFRFSNSLMRFGVEFMAPPTDSATHFGFQLGLAAYSIRYRLNQTDLIRDSSRMQNEDWLEWTPSLGFKVRSAGHEIRYAVSMTCGAGADCSPCLLSCSEDVVVTAPNAGGVIAAPTAALVFNGGRVVTQRLSISLRIR